MIQEKIITNGIEQDIQIDQFFLREMISCFFFWRYLVFTSSSSSRTNNNNTYFTIIMEKNLFRQSHRINYQYLLYRFFLALCIRYINCTAYIRFISYSVWLKSVDYCTFEIYYCVFKFFERTAILAILNSMCPVLFLFSCISCKYETLSGEIEELLVGFYVAFSL